jgi:hypothetical protein
MLESTPGACLRQDFTADDLQRKWRDWRKAYVEARKDIRFYQGRRDNHLDSHDGAQHVYIILTALGY